MRNPKGRALSIVSTTVKSWNPSAISSPKNAEVFGPGLLALFESRSEGDTTYSNVAKLISLLDKVTMYGTVIQNSHDVVIDLLNEHGDALVCFSYEISNFGQKTQLDRAHRFWFSSPQDDIGIEAYTNDGSPLVIEKIETSPNFSEVQVIFPRPLEPADQLNYRVQYRVKNGFKNGFYDIGTRSITNRISFTLLSPEGYRFDTKKVSQESSDGFVSETPPLISLSLEGGKEKLFWQHRKPKPGDQFRTHWSFV